MRVSLLALILFTGTFGPAAAQTPAPTPAGVCHVSLRPGTPAEEAALREVGRQVREGCRIGEVLEGRTLPVSRRHPERYPLWGNSFCDPKAEVRNSFHKRNSTVDLTCVLGKIPPA